MSYKTHLLYTPTQISLEELQEKISKTTSDEEFFHVIRSAIGDNCFDIKKYLPLNINDRFWNILLSRMKKKLPEHYATI